MKTINRYSRVTTDIRNQENDKLKKNGKDLQGDSVARATARGSHLLCALAQNRLLFYLLLYVYYAKEVKTLCLFLNSNFHLELPS